MAQWIFTKWIHQWVPQVYLTDPCSNPAHAVTMADTLVPHVSSPEPTPMSAAARMDQPLVSSESCWQHLAFKNVLHDCLLCVLEPKMAGELSPNPQAQPGNALPGEGGFQPTQTGVGGRAPATLPFWTVLGGTLCPFQSSWWNPGLADSGVVLLCWHPLLPCPLSRLPGHTSQINHLHPSPCLRLNFCRTPP